MLISIEVTPDIAAKIRLMAEAGVFALKDGSATLYFKGSHLTTIKSELYTYAKIDNTEISPILTVSA